MATTTRQHMIQHYVDNMSKIGSQKVKALNHLKTFCSELRQQIDRMENSVKEEIDLAAIRYKSKLQEQIKRLKEQESSTEEPVKKEPDSRKHLKQLSIELSLDRSILNMIKGSGKVLFNESETSIVQVKEETKKVKSIEMGSSIFNAVGKFQFQRQSTNVNMPINGTLLPNGNIIFAVPFPPSGQLLIYDQTGEQIKSVHLSSFPHSVIAIKPSLVCVSIQYMKYVEFRNVESLEIIRSVELPEAVSGLGRIGENLVLACENTGILIVNPAGETIKMIKAPIRTGYIDTMEENIFYIDTKLGNLFCFNSETGDKCFEVDFKFENSNGIAVLRDKSILISMFRMGKNNISRISVDGTKQVKQNEFSSLSWPCVMIYNSTISKLYVVHSNNQVSIFEEK
ncbi:Hypothetical predicted protein [Mytilus galloprovincialis]|uniref:Uncharacterized protein n=1 Tax=Mytilus galloprovincialis TaxID=29158 RepID=A0A8B6CQV5_MYTGA|nr:Hypothetical predicted protein [Mytilus galloprovincialis]